MNFLNIYKNKVICIPLLQRDYVQGGKESVISPFIDSLLDETNPSDLNYIYGYTEHGSFIPVDGQQRLTTFNNVMAFISLCSCQSWDDVRFYR